MILQEMKSIFLSVVLLTFFSCANHSQQPQGVQLVSAQAFYEALKTTPNATIIDVRTPEEFQMGHLQDAVNFNVLAPEFQSQVSKLDKTQPVFVYCKVGGRSADAVAKMKGLGFTTIYDMKGGYMAWASAGMETTKAERVQAENFTQADLDKLLSSGTPVLIDYYAPWCGPCKKMEPILNKLSAEYAGKVQIVRINVDEAATVVKSQNIDNIPVVSTFKSGTEIKRVNGFQDEAAMRAMIEEILK
jgi:thioredoxin 1